METIKHKGLAEYLGSTLTVNCEKCKESLSEKELAEHGFICPKCGSYNRMPARMRIAMLCDDDTFREMNGEVQSENLIDFPDYDGKLKSAREKSGENDGVICGVGTIGGVKTALFVMESKFMMGSMGCVVGDKITALFEYATAHNLPLVGYTVSGGARMQEGMISLWQMAKVSGAAKKHSNAGNFYLVCCTDPTTGGVTASFAMLGDVIIAEPGALVGFAGKRVIEQVTGEKLPQSFQSAEFQMENGFLDDIVPREKQRDYLTHLLKIHARGGHTR